MVLSAWKWRHIAKGALTWFPPLDAWRRRRISTGGTNRARYCYSVWLRHLVTLQSCGFEIRGARVGELGPGDSIGTGLAALLSGAEHYTGLDVVHLSAQLDLRTIFDELVRLYERREPIPDNSEFPRVSPRLKSYEFPVDLIEWTGFHKRTELTRADLEQRLDQGRMIHYQAPWNSVDDVATGSLDLIFSQAVLEYAAPLDEVYRAMSIWLKNGGYASHDVNSVVINYVILENRIHGRGLNLNRIIAESSGSAGRSNAIPLNGIVIDHISAAAAYINAIGVIGN